MNEITDNEDMKDGSMSQSDKVNICLNTLRELRKYAQHLDDRINGLMTFIAKELIE